ncbi:uncharacterized protein LOC117222233 [Megalopta genalis]|uniref:uncharacterized protein LOC117222233 n=1 Tax=Megalopta genalis TaxID=115081 RepID=UPI00144345C7|nr:zinc finger protein 510-like [Megalopta genalis]
MRVKTVPRHRILYGSNNIEPVSLVIVGKSERSLNRDIKSKEFHRSEEERKEALNYTREALDMMIKRKTNSLQKDLLNGGLMIAGPSSAECAKSSLKEKPNETIVSDDNNNILPSEEARCCTLAGPSSIPLSKFTQEDTKCSIQNLDVSIEAVNLCKKDHQEEDPTNESMVSSGKLKDTFLYKIMTDPTFLENIQKHKQPKKYSCQFCKQEFVNGEQLADHMDVKKDESNQVVCCACKKTFAQKRYLRYHQRCHSERTKFTCDICTKKYTRLDNLARHNAFHVNPDKFSCTYCEKTFARKDLLNKHLKCHDNKHRFLCQMCQKYFTGALALDNHNRIFHNIV